MLTRFTLALCALASFSTCGGGAESFDSANQPLVPNYTVRWDFEAPDSLGAWKLEQGQVKRPCPACSLSRVTTATPAPVYEGSASMKAHLLILPGDANQMHIENLTPAAPAPASGSFVAYHLWIPKGMPITDIHAYAKYGPSYFYADNYLDDKQNGRHTVLPYTAQGGWLTQYIPFPSSACTLVEIGWDIVVSTRWEGDVYVDGLAW